MSARNQGVKTLVVAAGQFAPALTDCQLVCLGIGCIYGLFISPITRPESFQPRRVHDIMLLDSAECC